MNIEVRPLPTSLFQNLAADDCINMIGCLNHRAGRLEGKVDDLYHILADCSRLQEIRKECVDKLRDTGLEVPGPGIPLPILNTKARNRMEAVGTFLAKAVSIRRKDECLREVNVNVDGLEFNVNDANGAESAEFSEPNAGPNGDIGEVNEPDGDMEEMLKIQAEIYGDF